MLSGYNPIYSFKSYDIPENTPLGMSRFTLSCHSKFPALQIVQQTCFEGVIPSLTKQWRT